MVENRSEIDGAGRPREAAGIPAISFRAPRQKIHEHVLSERRFRAGARKRAPNHRAAPRSNLRARRGMRQMDWVRGRPVVFGDVLGVGTWGTGWLGSIVLKMAVKEK